MKQNNKEFFEQLPNEISAGIVDPNSPLTSYATPMEELPPGISLSPVESMQVDGQEIPT